MAAPAAAPAATVETMVAGKQRVLRAAKPVKLVEKRRVKVGGRRCTVAGATPLGVLAGTSLALRVRDYGSCGRRAADAALLFVTSIAGERNRGQDGWVYKVGRKVVLGRGGRPLRPAPARRRPAAVVLLPHAAHRRLPAHARGHARPDDRRARARPSA